MKHGASPEDQAGPDDVRDDERPAELSGPVDDATAGTGPGESAGAVSLADVEETSHYRSEPVGGLLDDEEDDEDADLAELEDDEGGPKLDVSKKKIAAFILFTVAALAALYFLLPQIAGLEDTWHRIEQGDPAWLVVAFLCAVGSYTGYVATFQGVFVRAGSRIRWKESYQITMAAMAATRLFSAGGAGGLVLTAWALRRSGMKAQTVADRTVSFIVLQYLVYMLAIIIGGYGLYLGLFPGPAPFALTVIPATLSLVITALGLSMALVPTDFQRRLEGFATRTGRIGKLAHRLAGIPATVSAGMRDALGHVRRRNPAILGAILFWAFQIAVLWAAFRAFTDETPPLAVLVVGFFVGMFGNLLPLPGGIGGVDGGMIGAFAAFGVDGGLALVAVLVFRAFVFWLPTIPGVVAYVQLRKTVDRWKRESPRPKVLRDRG